MDTNFKEVYIVFAVNIEMIESGYEDDYEDIYVLSSPTLITESGYEAEEQAVTLVDEGAEASTFIKFRQYDNGKLEEVEGWDERYYRRYTR